MYSDEEVSNTFERQDPTDRSDVVPITKIDQIHLPIDLTKVTRNLESPIRSPAFNEANNSGFNDSNGLKYSEKEV
jgi:hypothetical protein